MGRTTEQETRERELEALSKRLDAIAWNLPESQDDLHLPPDAAWKPSVSESTAEDDPSPTTALSRSSPLKPP